MVGIAREVEVAHAELAKVAWMEAIDVCAMVMQTTGHAAAAGMLAVLADTAVTGRDVAALLAILPETSSLDNDG